MFPPVDIEKEAMLDFIRTKVERDDAFRVLVYLDHMKDKERLYGLLQELIRQGDRSMRDAVAPIGKSSGPIEIGDVEMEGGGVRIDEATADVVRAREELMVGDQQTYHVRFSMVDKSGKRCKVEIVGQEGVEIPCRITDPALMTARNVYTHALDAETVAEIQAKPVLREGRVKTLYISDGRPK